MKTFTTGLVIIFLASILSVFLPWYWWYVAAIAFVVVIYRQLTPGKSFLAGFFGVFFFSLLIILIRDIENGHILSTRMAGVFSLPNSILFIIVNVLLFGLVGGLAGWSGGLMNRAFRKK
jgi:hypothetical protein